MTFATTTSFSPLHIRSADTPPKPEKVITPGRELTREERKVARRRNGPMYFSNIALVPFNAQS
jgi:hypothetical protein